LQVGRLKDVPLGACYKAHCGGTWVWVMPDGMAGLADFTLVLHDIATLDPSAVYAPPPLVTLTRQVKTTINDPLDKGKVGALIYQETRAIKPEFKSLIEQKIQAAMQAKEGKSKKRGVEVGISWEQWMSYTVPYHGARVNVSSQGVGGGGGPTVPQAQPRNPEPAFGIEIMGRGSVKDSVELEKPPDVQLVPGNPLPMPVTVRIKRNTYRGEVPVSFSFVDPPAGVVVKPMNTTIAADKTSAAFVLTAGEGAKLGTRKAKVTITTPSEGEIAQELNVTVVEKKKAD
jgi:hypothetical protein